MKKQPEFPRMHVSLYVADLAKTLSFYSSFFGQEPEKVKDKYAKYHLNNPPLIISFSENPDRVQGNFGHLGIQVETQELLQNYLETAKNNGLAIREEVGTSCCYALQDKFWVTDPDGHQWEIYYFHDNVEFNDPKYSHVDTEVCCTPETKTEKPKIRIKADGSQENACCTPESNCC